MMNGQMYVFLFHNYLGMFLEQFGRIVLVFLYSPFFNKNKIQMFRKILSEVPRGAKRRAHCIIQIIIHENYYQSIYAVIIKVFQTINIICASLRSAPALGEDNIVLLFSQLFRNGFDLFRENGSCVSVSPFLNKNKIQMFSKIQSEVPRGAMRRAYSILYSFILQKIL